MKTKFPWINRRRKTDPEIPYETPIWLGSHSNGEYFHFQTDRDRKLRKLILERADDNARRVGLDRRQFMASAMGMATALLAINEVSGCSSGDSGNKTGKVNSGLCVPKEAQWNEQAACTAITPTDFVFDVQTHWFNQADTVRFPASVQALFGALFATTTEDVYLDKMFISGKYTHMAVLTAWPGSTCVDGDAGLDVDGGPLPCGLPLSNESMVRSREHIKQLACGTERVIQHCMVLANDPTGIDVQKAIMDQFYCEDYAYGWKMYPGFSSQQGIDPRGAPGYFMTDPVARAVIEHGLALGLNRFCVHKGLPIGNFFDPIYNYPKDIGPVAKDYKDANFIIYHSGICSGYSATNLAPPEAAYDPAEASPTGVNALIRSLQDNGIEPNSNVYAEVGSALNQIQADPVAAAHFFGKLMKYVGTDRVVWGTDCVIYGSPDPFIEWFQALTIPDQMQADFGYPPLDAANKAKIFGLNAAALYGVDPVAKRCQINSCTTAQLQEQFDGEFGGRRWMFERPGGPKTYREFVEHSRRQAKLGRPG